MKYKVKDYPDKDGFYGKYGGRFLSPEINEEFRRINDFYQRIEKPISVIKCGYELRTKAILTDEEFETILHSGPDKKLDSVRQYVIEHPECCKLIYEEAYSNNSIAEAVAFVKEKYQ